MGPAEEKKGSTPGVRIRSERGTGQGGHDGRGKREPRAGYQRAHRSAGARGAASGRIGWTGPADADPERSGRVFDRGNRGSSESEWQYGESEALSGPAPGGKPGEEARGLRTKARAARRRGCGTC